MPPPVVAVQKPPNTPLFLSRRPNPRMRHRSRLNFTIIDLAVAVSLKDSYLCDQQTRVMGIRYERDSQHIKSLTRVSTTLSSLLPFPRSSPQGAERRVSECSMMLRAKCASFPSVCIRVEGYMGTNGRACSMSWS